MKDLKAEDVCRHVSKALAAYEPANRLFLPEQA
jgi:hypothetical protein